MPTPRKPRPKPGGSRSGRRRRHEKAWLTKKIMAKFERYAELLVEKERLDRLQEPAFTAHEKAPGLAAEGFSSFFREREA